MATRLDPSKIDVDLLNRLVATEVDHRLAKRDPVAYAEQIKGVTDTVLNRMASGQFPNTTKGVANQRRQFSAISGPYNRKKGTGIYGGDVSNVPEKSVPSIQKSIVEQHLKQREAGFPSSVGGGLHYANPNYSDRVNQGWITALDGPKYGLGKSVHRHGTTAGYTPTEAILGDFTQLPRTRQEAGSQDMLNIASAEKSAMTDPLPRYESGELLAFTPQPKPQTNTMLASAGTPLMSAVEQMNAYAPTQSADSGVNAIEGLLGINPASPLSGAPRTPVTRSNLPDLPTQPKRDYPQLASRLGGISGDVLTQSKNPGMGGSNLATSPQVPTQAMGGSNNYYNTARSPAMGGSSAFLSGDLPQLPSSTVSQVGAANIPLTPLPSLPQAKAAPQFTPDYSNLEEIGGEKKKEEKESLADRVLGKNASKAAKIGLIGGAVLGVNPLAGAALGLGVNYLRNGNLSMPSLPSLNGIGDSVSNMFGKGSYIGPSGMDYAANTPQARGIRAMLESGKKGDFWDYNTDQGHDGIVNQVIQDREAAAMSGKKTKSLGEKLSEDFGSWF